MQTAEGICLAHRSAIKRNKAEVFQQWRDELLSRYIVEIDQEMLATVPISTVEPADTSTLGDSVTTLDK